MKRITFNLTLLTDLVISSSAANEGFHKSLDYIPGAKFLGLVARKLYRTESEHAQRSLDLFHNGTVRFGDAHPLIDEKLGYPIPFSWEFPKKTGVSGEVYLSYDHNPETYKELVDQDIQLKQVREGYISLDQKYCKVEQNFSIKSAYDREHLRSMDGQMYGYFSLKKGSIWQFSVDMADSNYEELITEALIGEKRMGRSSSSQYGRVDIQPAETREYDQHDSQGETAFIYAFSNLCFYDEQGTPLLQPDYKALGLPEETEIIWKNSKIRTRIYQTWNKKRNHRDADRYIIEKGSVIAVNLPNPLAANHFETGVGAHKSEGFGTVLLNPSFLPLPGKGLDWVIEDQEQDLVVMSPNPEKVAVKDEDQAFLNFFTEKKDQRKSIRSVDAQVNTFAKEYKEVFDKISPSQWGQVRNIARNTLDAQVLSKLLFDEKSGFLFTGQSKNTWALQNRITLLQKAFNHAETDQQIDFIIKLGTEMAKNT